MLAAQAQPDTIVVPPPPMQEEFTEAESDDVPTGHFREKEGGFAPDPVDTRLLPDSLLNAYKRDKAFWYADSIFNRDEQQQVSRSRSSQQQRRRAEQGQSSQKQSSGSSKQAEQKTYEPIAQQSWFQTLLWIIVIGGFIFFMLLYLNSFRKKSKSLKESSGSVEEEETEDIFAINYQRDIDRAAANGNYRLAIRLMFLRLLKNLSERNIIQYKQDRTNLDYLMQLSSTKYYADFFRITRNYEYAWYGKFEVKESAYKIIKNDFENFEPKTEVTTA